MNIKRRITKLEEKVSDDARTENWLKNESEMIDEAEREAAKRLKRIREQDNQG